jgi:hypothetical protein
MLIKMGKRKIRKFMKVTKVPGAVRKLDEDKQGIVTKDVNTGTGKRG